MSPAAEPRPRTASPGGNGPYGSGPEALQGRDRPERERRTGRSAHDARRIGRRRPHQPAEPSPRASATCSAASASAKARPSRTAGPHLRPERRRHDLPLPHDRHGPGQRRRSPRVHRRPQLVVALVLARRRRAAVGHRRRPPRHDRHRPRCQWHRQPGLCGATSRRGRADRAPGARPQPRAGEDARRAVRVVRSVLLDMPAVLAASEALTLAENIGGIAVVVNQGVTTEEQIKSALEELSGLPVLGVILNRSSSKVPGMHPPPNPRVLKAASEERMKIWIGFLVVSFLLGGREVRRGRTHAIDRHVRALRRRCARPPQQPFRVTMLGLFLASAAPVQTVPETRRRNFMSWCIGTPSASW